MKYDLVFEGGGAKGMVFVGACDVFFERGHAFNRLLGTSAGAITAALLAAGYTAEEMREALGETKDGKPVFAAFMGLPPEPTDEEIRKGAILKLLEGVNLKFVPDVLEHRIDEAIAGALSRSLRFRHVAALVERGGWYAADEFLAWLRRKLDAGTRNGQPRRFSAMTLAAFHAATGVELSVVAADTSDARMLVLNHRTAPDCPLVWAVRMSMSIPLVWNEVVWQAGWGRYLDRDIEGHAVVDGGMLSNFPIELFISDAPHVVTLMGPKSDTPPIGLLIDERLPVAPSAARGMFVDVHVKPAELESVQRLRRLVDTATTAHDKMVTDEYSHLVVRLPAAGYGTTEFDMSEARRQALVHAGAAAMATYLDARTASRAAGTAPRRGGRPATGNTADRIALRILE
jgi:predicted acylesterase/phospholipase RssA